MDRGPLIALTLLLSTGVLRVAWADCGLEAHRAQVLRTKAAIIYAAPVKLEVGEFLTPSGTHECVRVAFAITPWGRPWRLVIEQSSGEFPVETAVVRALRKYRFKPAAWGFSRSNSLVFDVVANRFPEGYFGKGHHGH